MRNYPLRKVKLNATFSELPKYKRLALAINVSGIDKSHPALKKKY